MSYRSFKKLLGETSLERKCRFLLGAFSLLLITASFWLYAVQTEHLAYEQIPSVCRLLVQQVVDEKILTACRGSTPAVANLEEFHKEQEKTWPAGLKDYAYRVIVPGSMREENSPGDLYSADRLRDFLADPDLAEHNKLLMAMSRNWFYGAVRATESCVACHAPRRRDLKTGDLLALVKIDLRVPPESLESKVHFNRAILISSALITALLTMAGTYMIVRYVIVKPVKHLKDVSDAITEGRLNVRSEIHSGDEFEDLSLAFNTMLRNLTAARENLERSNGDLDSKVEELALANLSLYESNKLKDDFLATMSHELRTPLNSILGFSDVLMQSEGLTEKQMRWAGNIRTSGQKLLDQVRDILDLAKMESGKMEVRPTEFGLDEACDSALSMFRPLAERQQIDLRGAWAENLPKLRQDMPKFQRILQNLLSNAIKFTPAGGVVCLLAEIHGDNLEVVVEDTGIGVAESEKELVFEKFRQAGNPLTREASGTGLGLSIVRELCLLLGGEIFLESELGKGSRFTVLLPARLNPAPRPEPAPDDIQQGAIIHRPRFSPPGIRPI